MRWRGRRQSTNVDDRRGKRTGGPGLKIGGIGGLVLIVVALYFGVDPRILLQGQGVSSTSSPSEPYQPTAAEQERAAFVRVVLAYTEDVWSTLFRNANRTYEEPTLVLFTDAVSSACGFAQAAIGPFYCPADKQVYIDLSFFDALARRFGAPGDFAQAYVVAHEVGHHLQTLLGISQQVHAQRRQLSQAEGNQLSVRQELQADCFAGVWAHHADKMQDIIESGDVEEALNAATAIGDDTLQRKSGNQISPESFTHGTSEQRVRWFRRGLETGDLDQCDTFAADRL
ncbi:MAG: neutral zinc metallopeptidase [Xanthomonadales bacterium]|nr:neutral zinc metallopeptidase [Xanthomonadales bacterium]